MKDHQIHQGTVSTSFLTKNTYIWIRTHITTKNNGFLAPQDHWEHLGQQLFLYDMLAIIENKHNFFNTHLSQFYKMSQNEENSHYD